MLPLHTRLLLVVSNGLVTVEILASHTLGISLDVFRFRSKVLSWVHYDSLKLALRVQGGFGLTLVFRDQIIVMTFARFLLAHELQQTLHTWRCALID